MILVAACARVRACVCVCDLCCESTLSHSLGCGEIRARALTRRCYGRHNVDDDEPAMMVVMMRPLMPGTFCLAATVDCLHADVNHLAHIIRGCYRACVCVRACAFGGKLHAGSSLLIEHMCVHVCLCVCEHARSQADRQVSSGVFELACVRVHAPSSMYIINTACNARRAHTCCRPVYKQAHTTHTHSSRPYVRIALQHRQALGARFTSLSRARSRQFLAFNRERATGQGVHARKTTCLGETARRRRLARGN